MWRAALILLLTVLFVPLCCVAQDSVCTQQELTEAHIPTVQSIKIEGGGALANPAEGAAKTALQGPNRRCQLDAALREAAELIRRVYQENGYYKAVVEDPTTQPASAGQVDVVFTVNPGTVYTVREITFTHVTVFPPDQLRALFSLRPGDVFNARMFATGLEGLRKLYTGKGYIKFAPIPTPDFDDAARTVGWTVDMDEGPRFTIGALVLDGPEPAPGVGKRLIADWQPLIGQVYNPELLKRFLLEHAMLLRMRNPDPESMIDALIDNKEHIVTVRLNFPD